MLPMTSCGERRRGNARKQAETNSPPACHCWLYATSCF
jgi:hypothetical protein